MAYNAQTQSNRHTGALAAPDTPTVSDETSEARRLTTTSLYDSFPIAGYTVAPADPTVTQPLAQPISQVTLVKKTAEGEAVQLFDTHISKLGLLIYVVVLLLYAVRLLVGYLPAVYPWVPWLILSLVAAGGTCTWLFRNHKWHTPIFVLLTFFGAGTITFGLYQYGLDNTFSDLYLLTLVMPMVYFSSRLSMFTVTGVSVLSVVPYIFGPVHNDEALATHLLIRVPCYFVATLLVNRTVLSALNHWREINKHRRLSRDLAVLQELTTYIASTQDIQAICDTVVDHLRGSFGYSFISIHLLQKDEQQLNTDTSVETAGHDARKEIHRPPFLKLMTQYGYTHSILELPLGKGVLNRAVRTAKPLIIRDAHDEADFIYTEPSIRSEVCAPIIKRGSISGIGKRSSSDDSSLMSPDSEAAFGNTRVQSQSAQHDLSDTVLGVISLEDAMPNALGEDDLNLIVTVASALSVALENLALMQEWQERGTRLELVNQVAHAVAAKLDLADVLHAARDQLQRLVPVDRATLSLITEDGKHMEIAAVEGVVAAHLSQKGALIPLSSFQPASALNGHWLVLPELPPDSPYPFVQNLYAAGMRSHLSIPLQAADKVVGLFALSAMKPNAYTEEHIPLLESIAPHLATAVQNAQLYRAIKHRAETDNLTRLLNLPTFYFRLKEYLAESKTTGLPLSVVMLDLDLFKSYNDSFGHVAGDSVLRQVAALIKRCLRHEDVAARYGGDEFALIIPGLRSEEALSRVTSICETIGHTPFMPEDDPDADSNESRVRGVAVLSASAGVASFPSNSADPEQLVHMADTALYEAKRRGRNRAVTYGEDGNSIVQTTTLAQPSRHKRFRAVTDTDPELDAYEERDLRTASNEYLQAIYAMASAIELRDGYTHGHSERIAFYATRLGEAVGLSGAEIAALRIAGLLHDIGKISLPYELVHKPDKLTEEEWELVRQHPLQGETIVRPLRNFEIVWPMIAAHHENYDGTGYPKALAEDAIPVGGRILRIADAYEVMTVSGRSYHKAAKSPVEAVDELQRCSGTMFDPSLVELFITTVIGDPKKTLSHSTETIELSDEILDA